MASILDNVRLQMNYFSVWVVHKGYLNVAHLFSLNGAVGSTPWLWDSPPDNRDALSISFFHEKEVSTQSSVEEDPDSLLGTISLWLCSNGLSMSISIFFCKLSFCKLILHFSLRYITATTVVTLPVFAFSIAFSAPLMVLSVEIVTLIGRGSVDIKLKAKGLSKLKRLSTCNPVSLYPDSYSLSKLH